MIKQLRQKYIYWKFRREANVKYRVLERTEGVYEIQVFQDIGINVSNMQWTPLLVDEITKDSCIFDYERVCRNLRESYYKKLVRTFDDVEREKERKRIYPRVVY